MVQFYQRNTKVGAVLETPPDRDTMEVATVPIQHTRPQIVEQHRERFFSRVEITEGCWLWLGRRNDKGYGLFDANGRHFLAHRFSWQLHHGTSAGEKQLCHHCDTPNCVNPAHLFAGTQADNMQDMVRKGRHWNKQGGARLATGDRNGARSHPERLARGERNGHAVLSTDQVVELRRLYATGRYRQVDLASRFGIKQQTLSKIVRGLLWSHLPLGGAP